MAIDVGSEAIDRDNDFGGSYTFIDLNNPANANGTIDTVEIWSAVTISSAKVGTFYNTGGSNYKCRDSEAIGSIVAGAKRTFSGLSITVQAGDFLGIYWDSNLQGIESTYGGGGSGVRRVSGDYANPDDEVDFSTLFSNSALSLYGTGTEVAGNSPSSSPSSSPSTSPSASASPSSSPSSSPSASSSPSVSPSTSPSVSPSGSPSSSPSQSSSPSGSPSGSESNSPSASPSVSPSGSYSGTPSASPSSSPSMSLSNSPSGSPSSSLSTSASPSASPSPGTGGDVLVDTSARFHADMVGCLVYMTSGENAGQSRRIAEVSDAHTLVLESGFDNEIAVNDRYSISPVPVRARLSPLQDREVDLTRETTSRFARWKLVGAAVACEEVSGFRKQDNYWFRIGAHRNSGTTMEPSVAYLPVSENPQQLAEVLKIDGVDIEPVIEQISCGTKFSLTDAEFLVTITDSRKVTT